jgi:2-polyprenyl-3-methyl-5-hydroxy-6-metoxy-1,4-benzoquinol methylase
MPCISFCSEAPEPSYALATGKQDEERLTILNELHNPSTLSKLNIIPGVRILTIGCGIGLLEQEMAKKTTPDGYVLGTDISEEQILIAKQNCESENLKNLEFLQLGVLNIDQVSGTFDRIHCRYVLTHLPWGKILEIIPLLYSKLASGGFLLLEECATIDSLFCEPPHLGYDKWEMLEMFFSKGFIHPPA